MPEPAVEQLHRLVQLVAELSRDAAADPVPVARVAKSLGVPPERIYLDLRALTEVADDPEATWLMSLQVIQEGDSIGVSSRGPYRRPIRFTAEELVALRLAIALETPRPSAALRELGAPAAAEADDAFQPPPLPHGELAEIVDAARAAAAEHRRLRIGYAAPGAGEPAERVIQPHLVVQSEGRFYVVAWCETARDWRHFRADRIVDAAPAGGTFAPRADVPDIERSSDLFRGRGDDLDDVTVRYSARVARWVAEHHPDARRLADGRIEVTLPSASISWAIGTVLQYGADAEIVSPAAYREAMRRAVRAGD